MATWLFCVTLACAFVSAKSTGRTNFGITYCHKCSSTDPMSKEFFKCWAGAGTPIKPCPAFTTCDTLIIYKFMYGPEATYIMRDCLERRKGKEFQSWEPYCFKRMTHGTKLCHYFCKGVACNSVHGSFLPSNPRMLKRPPFRSSSSSLWFKSQILWTVIITGFSSYLIW